MTLENYVSVTAGVNKQEVLDVMRLFAAVGCNMQSEHVPALGFLASQKTVHNPNENVRNLRFPVFNEIPALMRSSGNEVLTVLHYNPDNYPTNPTESHSEQVINAVHDVYSNGLCRTVQLNSKGWYDIAQVESIKERYNGLRIILQVSAHAMEGLSPDKIAGKINGYGSAIDYVLIDPSRGLGLEFNVDHSASVFKSIKSLAQDYSVVFAGGLNGENVVESISKLISKIGTTDFSIDAEGRLRDRQPGEQYFGNDLLNLSKTESYIRNAHYILNKEP